MGAKNDLPQQKRCSQGPEPFATKRKLSESFNIEQATVKPHGFCPRRKLHSEFAVCLFIRRSSWLFVVAADSSDRLVEGDGGRQAAHPVPERMYSPFDTRGLY